MALRLWKIAHLLNLEVRNIFHAFLCVTFHVLRPRTYCFCRRIHLGHMAPRKNLGKKGSIERSYTKVRNLKNAVRVRQKLRTKKEGHVWHQRGEQVLGQHRHRHACSRREWRHGRSLFNWVQSKGQRHVLLPFQSSSNSSTSSKKPRGSRIRGRFRCINAHAE